MTAKDFDELVYTDHLAYPPVSASSVEYSPAHIRRSRFDRDDLLLGIVGIVAAVVVSALSVVAFIVELTN